MQLLSGREPRLCRLRKLMSRKKILIVDDNEVILKTLAFKLKANDYDVVTALDGSQALGDIVLV